MLAWTTWSEGSSLSSNFQDTSSILQLSFLHNQSEQPTLKHTMLKDAVKSILSTYDIILNLISEEYIVVVYL